MRICIIGVGNIGMRYVQGIRTKFPNVELWLVDNDSRLEELKNLELGKVRLFNSVDCIDSQMDIIVISTSCEPRLSIYKKCLKLDPKFVVLEKYLFKSRNEFNECLSLTRVPTFVNQWMYGSRTFDCLFENEGSSVELAGSGWGLACNAVHWMDVFKRHLQITQLMVGEQTKITNVFPSKRAGYEEISGEFEFVDRDSDKMFKLIDRNGGTPGSMLEISVDGRVYTFDYSKIRIKDKVLSQFPFFSDLIGDHCRGHSE